MNVPRAHRVIESETCCFRLISRRGRVENRVLFCMSPLDYARDPLLVPALPALATPSICWLS